MREAMSAFLLWMVLAVSVPILAQTTGFTLKEFLAPRYLAPEDAPSKIVIAGRDEPGERLIVTGRTLDTVSSARTQRAGTNTKPPVQVAMTTGPPMCITS